jgi:S1-C subfamily serine protease
VFEFTILDILLLLLLLGYLIAGLRNGFLVTLGGIVGFAAGAVAAFFAIPLVSTLVPDDGWRLTAIIATAVVLIIVGQALGAGFGGAIRRWMDFPPLRLMDRLLGGAMNLVVAALVLSMLAFSVSSLGVPFISQQIAASRVITGIDAATPDPVKAWLAQLRSIVVQDGIPKVIEGVAPDEPVTIPDANVDTPALNQAAESVLRIAGTAFQCGQNQTGSGFVIAPERVITNAHVVAGVNEPVVEVPRGAALPARVVYFDAVSDLAVLAVDGLETRPLPLGEPLPAGAPAAFAGYPAGGPLRLEAASVQGMSDVFVQNIYGAEPSALQIYTLAADVQQGNSGGPLLDQQGRVAGVIFARATENTQVGYALSLAELAPVAAQAPALSETVSAGQCIRG